MLGLLIPYWKSALAQSLRPVGAVQETFQKRIPVGGRIVVSVSAVDPPGRVDPRSLWALIPVDPGRVLCVNLLSADGRYQAQVEYDLAGVAPGPHRLEFPTKYAPELSGFSTADFGVLAMGVDDCNSFDGSQVETPKVAVTLWSVPRSLDFIVVKVQTGQTSAVLYVEGARTGPIACHATRALSTAAFDAECVIAVSMAGMLRLRIERWHFQDRLDSTPLMIGLP